MSPSALATSSSASALLALFIAGHLLADFYFQTYWMAREKRRVAALLTHVGEVVAVQLVVVSPFLGRRVVLAVLAVGVAHAGIDVAKSRWPFSRPGRLALFLLDQAAHLVVLVVAWWLLVRAASPPASWLTTTQLDAVVDVAVVAGALAFNWTGGSVIVSSVLAALSPGIEERQESSGVRGSGRLIGGLERTVAVLLILLGQWAAIVVLIAAKSIARFEELKQRDFAEYYLVGTLTSLLVAAVVGLVLGAVVIGLP
jgi:Protein of unknown function (DUF3307)